MRLMEIDNELAVAGHVGKPPVKPKKNNSVAAKSVSRNIKKVSVNSGQSANGS